VARPESERACPRPIRQPTRFTTETAPGRSTPPVNRRDQLITRVQTTSPSVRFSRAEDPPPSRWRPRDAPSSSLRPPDADRGSRRRPAPPRTASSSAWRPPIVSPAVEAPAWSRPAGNRIRPTTGGLGSFSVDDQLTPERSCHPAGRPRGGGRRPTSPPRWSPATKSKLRVAARPARARGRPARPSPRSTERVRRKQLRGWLIRPKNPPSGWP